MSEQLDTVERMAKEALAELQREYQLRAQPYIDILCRIDALRPPSRIIFPFNDLNKWKSSIKCNDKDQ